MIKLQCACCDGPLEPAQQLRFLVETDNLDNPSFLNRIRSLPSVNGKPVPVCQPCQTKMKATPRPAAKRAPHAKPHSKTTHAKAPLALAFVPELLGVLGVLSVGMLLGTFLSSRG